MTLEDGAIVITFNRPYTLIAGETVTITNSNIMFVSREHYDTLKRYYDWDDDWRKLQPRRGLVPWLLRLLWRLP